jgi:[citrate (pro-3S)-lyase] ligase
MNANPFTLGHRYLIETAARECDRLYVFVPSEDRSCFSAADRMEMVRLGTSDLQNVTVLPTGPYLISSATFPTYFLKENASPSDVQCRLDTAIFTKHYAPRLSITRRYVGTEPHCPVTKSYNRVMAQLLPAAGITFIEVPRLEMQNAPISASSVRELLTQHKDIRFLVPDSTYQYLLSHHFL